MSIDPFNSSDEHFINSDVNNPFLAGEKYKVAQYAKTISSVNENSHAQYNLMDKCSNQLYAECKSHHIEAFVEPFVRRLSPENEDENTFGKRRADLITLGSDAVIKVVDVVTVDVCKDSAIDVANKDETPLCFAEKSKIKKYSEPVSQLGRVEHVKYQLVPLAVSLFGNIGISGIKFLESFRSLLKERAGKELNFNFWHKRIVFSKLKAISEMIIKALLQIGIEYENRALKRFDDVDVCIEDIEFYFFLFNVLLALKIQS
ncbi:hypothetical protein P9112_011775 [Eukaryota sp. TZLM1-RC]